MPDLGTIGKHLQVPSSVPLKIFVDESGDLGWNFAKPFNEGGSSRYMTMACLILPRNHYRRPGEVIAEFYKTYKWQREKKASHAKDSQRALFCDRLAELLLRHPEIKVDVITVNKLNVQPHIRRDPNKLYNYMLGLIVPDYVRTEESFELITDERSIKVRSENSLKDYLQIKLWFEVGCATRIVHSPGDSSQDYTLQFVDWISHCSWRNYERNDAAFCEKIRHAVRLRQLFF